MVSIQPTKIAVPVQGLGYMGEGKVWNCALMLRWGQLAEVAVECKLFLC